MARLPGGSNHGMVAVQLPQAPIKQNGITDWVSVQIRKNSTPQQCLHPAMTVGNEVQDQQFQAMDGQAVWTYKSMLKDTGRNYNGAVNHSSLNEDIRIMGDTSFNGWPELNIDKIHMDLVPLGLIEGPGNRDNGRGGSNFQSGGSRQIPNFDLEGHTVADYLYLCCPTAKERHMYRSNHKIANRIGNPKDPKNGPVGLVEGVYRKFDPSTVNFYDWQTAQETAREVTKKHLTAHVGNAMDAATGLRVITKLQTTDRKGINHEMTALPEKFLYALLEGIVAANDFETQILAGAALTLQQRNARIGALFAAIYAAAPGALSKAYAPVQIFLQNSATCKKLVHDRVKYSVMVGAGIGEDQVVRSVDYAG